MTEATIVYPGDVSGRPTIELRVDPTGSNEAFLVPTGGAPVRTGVSLIEKSGLYFIYCRIRNKRLKFKPEEVVRQKVLGALIRDIGYSPDQIKVEVPVVMGATVHEKAADIVIYDETTRKELIIVEVKKPNRKDGIDQLKAYMNATGAPFGLWSDGVDEKFLLRTGAKGLS